MQTRNVRALRRETIAAQTAKSGQAKPLGSAAPLKNKTPTPLSQVGGFKAFDAFARTGALGIAPSKAAKARDGDDPFRGLVDVALIRAVRGATFANKRNLDYSQVRGILFKTIDNHNGKVTCVYTGRVYDGGGVPDHTKFNLEHVWPQSRGAKGNAKSDMHNLMITDSDANSKRGNVKFGLVVEPEWKKGESVLGRDATGETVFTPPAKIRGNIARTIFYFSAVYGFAIDPKEEAVLRAWHDADPVDAAELKRTHAIAEKQGDVNFFIKHPHLVGRISDF